MPINRAAFNALVDDDGSGNVGTPWEKARIAGVILDPVDAELANPLVGGFEWAAYTPGLVNTAGGTWTSPLPYARYVQGGLGGKSLSVQYAIDNGAISVASAELRLALPFAASSWAGVQSSSVQLYLSAGYETGWAEITSGDPNYLHIGRNGGQLFSTTGLLYVRGQFIYRAA